MEAVSFPSEPQAQPTGKRKANTSTASLHAETDIATAVSNAASAALTTLDAKFKVRFNTLQQVVADTNNSLNNPKSYTEATNNSLNALKNYTESTTAEIHARLECRKHPPTFGQLATLQPHSCTAPIGNNGHSAYDRRDSTSQSHGKSRFVLNVYTSPGEKVADFCRLFTESISLVGDAQLLLLGDFNARHPDWGDKHTDPKDRQLWSLEQDLLLTQPNDTQHPPMRIGNSVCRDTLPDLTLCKDVTRATWDNTGLSVESDQNILAITIETRLNKKPKPTARITDWPTFHPLREEQAFDAITDINE
ncbi:hypothetical protein HPB51_006174 [Rhipicephalus microplus]|uniref:Endonuclease/exonuclease/phosphatase domain-containing protein n=1 Tax=Rhipicephalus microplus TaxID=6941 RepID=A0A9J6E7A3_RHIMP|nr:hypothetical protein HPB51_006174 [Rhipicephalus microplus]